ncbi:MAG: hypothetical protein QM662_07780 [Gordonia sp. (in: high G+C Gram-positive bacteria)]
MTAVDLTSLGVQDLLQLDAAIIAELRRRGLVRTSNKPLGDVAEAVVHAARGGVLVFDLDFNLTEAREVDAAEIEQTRLVAHVNGRQPTLRWVRSVGTEVTAEMQAAWTRLNETPT